jgi:hypothetical protein
MSAIDDPLTLLESIPSMSWQFEGVAPRDLKHDPPRGIYATSGADATVAAIFGPMDPLRNWHSPRFALGRLRQHVGALRSARRARTCGPFELPEDAVVISKNRGRTVVVASESRKLVLKLERHIHVALHQAIACRVDEAFRRAAMSEFIPKLIAQGLLVDGGSYLVSELIPNRPPLFRTLHGGAWPGILAKRVIPILQTFHDRNGCRILTAHEWREQVEEKLDGRRLSPAMQLAWQADWAAISRCDGLRVPVGMISGDLQPQNIHFSREIPTILDWSNIKDASLMIDVFSDVFYKAMASPKAEAGAVFWRFLSKHEPLGKLPQVIRDTASVWTRWMDSWLGIKVDEEILRMQMRGMCWDWLVTMEHPWKHDGSLWRDTHFPTEFLENAG